MIEGITINELAQTLNSALEEMPQLGDYVIDNIETTRIENNGYYLIKFYGAGDCGQTCTIAKCLRPDRWEPKNG